MLGIVVQRRTIKGKEHKIACDQIIRHLFRDENIGIQYNEKTETYVVQGFELSLYHQPLKARVEKEIFPGKTGRVTHIGGVSWTAYAGQNVETISVCSSVWVIGRYGNTLLVEPMIC